MTILTLILSRHFSRNMHFQTKLTPSSAFGSAWITAAVLGNLHSLQKAQSAPALLHSYVRTGGCMALPTAVHRGTSALVQPRATTAHSLFYLKFYCLLTSAPRASRIIETSTKGNKRWLQILLPYCNLQCLHSFLMARCFLHHCHAFATTTENDEARGRGLQS